jgi:hypothetical protein
VDLLIAGASQPQRAIIPSMLDESLGTYSYNLGGGWMNLIGDYRLLETELERNPVKDVFLAVSYATLTRTEASDDYEGDTYIVPRLETMQDKADYVLRCVDYRGYVSLYEYYVQQGWAYMLSAIRGEPVHNVNYDYRGWRPVTTKDVSLAEDKVDQMHDSKPLDVDVRDENVKQLQDVLTLCRDHGAKVYLVVIPLSDQRMWRQSGWDTFLDYMQAFADENDVPLYDFNLLKNRWDLFNDKTSYCNDNHLSEEGAKVFTPVFAEIMGKAMAGEDVSAYFYDSYEQVKDMSPYAK